MKTVRILLSFFLSCVAFSMLTAQTASDTLGCAPLVVNFQPPAGTNTFFWTFGNGDNSTARNPETVYSTPGTYTVEFRTSQGGDVEGTISITVLEKPTLTLVADPMSGCQPLQVDFSNGSTIDPRIIVNSYNWTFQDGTTASTTAPNTTHTYNNVGTYKPALSIQTALSSCSVPEVQLDEVITVSESPEPSFSASSLTSCAAPLTVTFTNTTVNGGGLTYSWDFGNGNTSTNPTPLPQTYLDEGVFPVVLTATDANGCSATFTRNVTVGPPNIDFEIPDTVCVGDSVMITNNSDFGIYAFTFGPNASPPTSTDREPAVVFTQPGTYQVSLTLTSTNGGCMGTLEKTIVATSVDAGFTFDPAIFCEAPTDVTFTPNTTIAGATYTWDFGDGDTSTMINPIHTFEDTDPRPEAINGADTFFVQLTVETAGGCTATTTERIILHQPESYFVPDVTKGCAPLAVTFSDSSTSRSNIVSWVWVYGDGDSETFNSSMDPSHTYTTAGEYEAVLIVTNANGCMDTSAVVLIEVGSPLTVDFTVDKTEVCPGDTVRMVDITNSGGVFIDAYHFETDGARSHHCFQEDSLNYAFITETGDMDVTLFVEYNGCYSQTTKGGLIQVKGPIAQIDYEIDCDTPFNVTFRDSSDDATSLTWLLGDGNMNMTNDTFIHTYADEGVYQVTLIAENATTGCPADTATATVYIQDITAMINAEDTMVCIGEMVPLDASMSMGSVEDCWRGYTWKFQPEVNRPITTQDSIIDFMFNDTGRVVVELIAIDINGCTDTTFQGFDVHQAIADFEVDNDTFCLPATVAFTEMSSSDTTLVTWEWDFGDMTTSEDQNPDPKTYTTAMGETITVSLRVVDAAGCDGSKSIDLFVYEPFSNIIADPSLNICVGDDITFTATDFTAFGSSLSYDWDFGPGGTSTNQTETITFNTAGIVPITLNFTEIASGCTGQTSAQVSVQDFPVAMFSVDDLDPNNDNCYPITAQFTDETVTDFPPLTYFWNVPGLGSSTEMDPSFSFGKGTFDVNLTVSTSNGCTDMTSQTYTLVGPEGQVLVTPNDICVGDQVTVELINAADVSSFTFFFGDGTSSSDVSPVTHVYDEPAPNSRRIIRYVLNDATSSCTFEDSVFVTLRNTMADFAVAGAACVGEPVQFTNNSVDATAYIWDFGDGSPTSGDENPQHIYNQMGTFTVTLTALNPGLDCEATISQEISIGDVFPQINFDTTVCVGEVNFVLPLPSLEGFTPTFSPPGLVTGSGAGPYSVSTNLSADSDSLVITLTVDANGPAECAEGESTFSITATEGFQVPNAFTPNGDGNNDFFTPIFDPNLEGRVEVVQFMIFDRYGKKVYDNDDPGQGWNGMVNGKFAASDVYLYIIEMSGFEGCGESVRKGDVTLIR